jgi:predicted transcriptional regulator
MQTTIDIPEEQVGQLEKLSQARNIPRDEIVRLAISAYLRSRSLALEQSLGAWAGAQGDGVEYQQRVRGEWS